MDYPSNADRRKHKRVEDIFTVVYRFRETIDVAIRQDQQEYIGVAVDISAGGIGVEATQKILTGTSLRLKFTLLNPQAVSAADKRRTFEINGQSRHCRPTLNGAYRTGILFDNLSADDNRFIAEYVKAQLQKK